MSPVRIAVAQKHIAESHVDDVVFAQSLQQLFPFDIVSAYGVEDESAAEHGNILVHCFSGYISPFSALNVALSGQNISDAVGRSDAADIGTEEQHDLLQHVLVSLMITL